MTLFSDEVDSLEQQQESFLHQGSPLQSWNPLPPFQAGSLEGCQHPEQDDGVGGGGVEDGGGGGEDNDGGDYDDLFPAGSLEVYKHPDQDDGVVMIVVLVVMMILSKEVPLRWIVCL